MRFLSLNLLMPDVPVRRQNTGNKRGRGKGRKKRRKRGADSRGSLSMVVASDIPSSEEKRGARGEGGKEEKEKRK